MEYILNARGNLTLDFPENKFGYNDLEAKLLKINNPDVANEVASSMIKPFNHLKFQGGVAKVTDEATIKKAVESGNAKEIRKYLERPWTIEMVRETIAYQDEDVWELSNEQVDQIRKMDQYPSMILPKDFNNPSAGHQEKIDFLRKAFYTPAKKLTEKECDEYLHGLQEAMSVYRVVNISLPRKNSDITKYARLLEASRVQIESLFDELGQ